MASMPKPSNTPKYTTEPLIFNQFTGGLSDDPKIGIKYSFQDAQGFDFRTSPSQLSVLPGMTREDNGIMKDLVLAEVMVGNGIIYALGDAGFIYRRSTAGVWSMLDKLSSGAAGMDYRKDTDAVYLTSYKTASRIGQVVNGASPTLNTDYYASSISLDNETATAGINVNADQEGSTLTTNILVATVPLNESDQNRRYFQTDIEPLNKISVYVVTKGTGDWTLTLQDGINNVLATATVTNANLVSNSWNDFVFTGAPNGQVRVYPGPDGRIYHYHVTSTVADGKVSSSVMNDLSTSDCQIWADRFVQTNNNWHPALRFLQYETFGNGNYLSAWEPIDDPPTNAQWQRHRLTFPEEYEVSGLTLQNEFEVIAAGKNTTLSTSVPQEGMLFYWDGLESSPSYNYNIPVPEGTPYGLHTYKNIVYYFAGGSWWALTSPTTQPVKQKQMPGTATEFSGAYSPIIVYPNAATVRRDIQMLAWPGSVPNTNIRFGIWSWGSTNKNYPESLGYNYQISTGSQNYSASNNLKLGMAQAYGDLMHVSWRDDLNGGYGMDVITNSSNPAGTAYIKPLRFDGGWVAKKKTAYYVEAFYIIPSGCTVTLAYSLDLGAFQTSAGYTSTSLWEGEKGYARFSIGSAAKFHNIDIMLTFTNDSTVTVAPILQALDLIWDSNLNELPQ